MARRWKEPKQPRWLSTLTMSTTNDPTTEPSIEVAPNLIQLEGPDVAFETATYYDHNDDAEQLNWESPVVEMAHHLARHHLERCPAGTDGLPLYVRLKGWLKRQEVLVRPLGFKGP